MRLGLHDQRPLFADLTAALADQTLPKRIRYYCRFDLLVIDELLRLTLIAQPPVTPY